MKTNTKEGPMVEETKKEAEVALTEVVTQTDIAYKLPDGKIVSMQEYLVWLGNLVYKISKSVA
jgi:hypothetical protein